MKAILSLGSVLAISIASGCASSPVGEQSFASVLNNTKRTKVDVKFYDISANTFSELDREIALHGPFVAGVGKAIASTNVKMIPDIRFVQVGTLCRVLKAQVKVKAKVTLPRLKKNKIAPNNELTKAFGNLENYAAVHEAVHVSIAETYAKKAEKQISSLKPRANCNALEQDAVKLFRSTMVEHRNAQLKFDEDEKVRFNTQAKTIRIYKRKIT